MESRKVPALIALAGVVVAVALFLVLKSDTADKDTELSGDSAVQGQTQPTGEPDAGGGGSKPDPKPEPKPEIPTIEIKDGEPVGGVQEIEILSGSEGAFKVTSDVDDELHFHGYDAYIDLVAGKPKEFSFKADIEGLFELESHTTGVVLAEISVVPN